MSSSKKYSKEFKLDAIWPVVVMCHVLVIKSNNFYSYQKHKANKPEDPTHDEMISWVKDIAKFSDNTYGARRIKKVLNTLSYPPMQGGIADLFGIQYSFILPVLCYLFIVYYGLKGCVFKANMD